MGASDIAVANRAMAMIGQDLIISAMTENAKLNAVYTSERDTVLAMHPWNFALKRDRVTAAGILNCSSKIITFADNDPDTITDDGSGFVSAGFEGGDIANIAGSAQNEATYNVDSVVAGTLTLESSEEVTAEVLTNDADLKLYALTSDGRFKFAKPSDCLRVHKVNEVNIWNEPYPWAKEGKFIIADTIDENDQLPIVYIKQVTDPTLFDPLFEECFVIRLCAVMSMADKENTEQAKFWNTHFDFKFKQATQRNAYESKKRKTRRRTSWQGSRSGGHEDYDGSGRFYPHKH